MATPSPTSRSSVGGTKASPTSIAVAVGSAFGGFIGALVLALAVYILYRKREARKRWRDAFHGQDPARSAEKDAGKWRFLRLASLRGTPGDSTIGGHAAQEKDTDRREAMEELGAISAAEARDMDAPRSGKTSLSDPSTPHGTAFPSLPSRRQSSILPSPTSATQPSLHGHPPSRERPFSDLLKLPSSNSFGPTPASPTLSQSSAFEYGSSSGSHSSTSHPWSTPGQETSPSSRRPTSAGGALEGQDARMQRRTSAPMPSSARPASGGNLVSGSVRPGSGRHFESFGSVGSASSGHIPHPLPQRRHTLNVDSLPLATAEHPRPPLPVHFRTNWAAEAQGQAPTTPQQPERMETLRSGVLRSGPPGSKPTHNPPATQRTKSSEPARRLPNLWEAARETDSSSSGRQQDRS